MPPPRRWRGAILYYYGKIGEAQKSQEILRKTYSYSYKIIDTPNLLLQYRFNLQNKIRSVDIHPALNTARSTSYYLLYSPPRQMQTDLRTYILYIIGVYIYIIVVLRQNLRSRSTTNNDIEKIRLSDTLSHNI